MKSQEQSCCTSKLVSFVDLASLNNPDLILSQSIKLVDQGVYLLICGLYLALEGGLLVWCTGPHRVVFEESIRSTRVTMYSRSSWNLRWVSERSFM